MTKTVLLTGGAGYIGSHTCVALIDAGFHVVIVDDFSNAAEDVATRMARITGQEIPVHKVNVGDTQQMNAVFAAHRIDAVIHLAGRKSVPQSLSEPQGFFDANIAGLLILMKVMAHHRVNTLVYSSSATVYGMPEALPIPEHAPLGYTNPYGLSKLVGEQFVSQKANRCGWAVGILRYFNPAGAHPSGLIGEGPRKGGGNLMPLVASVAMGKLPAIDIFGHDYGTPDGTGIRDFVHVCDLARGHVQSLRKLFRSGRSHTVNLGKGRGYSVLDVIKTYEHVSGTSIPYRLRPRRKGDVAASFADPSMAASVLGFEALFDLREMCRSSWQWEQQQALGWPNNRCLHSDFIRQTRPQIRLAG